jgi:DNA-binding beta-propeller fold protein YncE
VTELRIDPNWSWTIPGEAISRPEGVAFSPCGGFVAIAEAGGDRVSVHARGSNGTPPREPCRLEGPTSGIDYPHDVDFSPDGRLLAVANRTGAAVTLYTRRNGEPGRYGPRPVWTIGGRRARLTYSEGVRFVPPLGNYIAAVSLANASVNFYRRGWLRRSRFATRPCFRLRGPETKLHEPDGLAFSPDGALLAVANHGAHTVTIYARRARSISYGPAPVAVLGTGAYRFHCPHSVAFHPDGLHLAISNAGARHVSVFRRATVGADARWSEAPVLELEACDAARFGSTNRDNTAEGGSKGVAFGDGCFGVCNEHFGLRVHRMDAARAAATRSG